MDFLVQVALQTVCMERRAGDAAGTISFDSIYQADCTVIGWIQLPLATDDNGANGTGHLLEVDGRWTTGCSDWYFLDQPRLKRAPMQARNHLLLRDAITSNLAYYSAASIVRTPAVCDDGFPPGTFVAH